MSHKAASEASCQDLPSAAIETRLFCRRRGSIICYWRSGRRWDRENGNGLDAYRDPRDVIEREN